MYFEMKILVIWNNLEFGVLMNGRVKRVENQGKNSECMHVKCNYVVIIMLNNFVEIHFYQSHINDFNFKIKENHKKYEYEIEE
jgi:hypothetical protein